MRTGLLGVLFDDRSATLLIGADDFSIHLSGAHSRSDTITITPHTVAAIVSAVATAAVAILANKVWHHESPAVLLMISCVLAQPDVDSGIAQAIVATGTN